MILYVIIYHYQVIIWGAKWIPPFIEKDGKLIGRITFGPKHVFFDR